MIPFSGRVPGRASGPSQTRVDDSGGLQYFSWMEARVFRVFPMKWIYRRKGEVGGRLRGPDHRVARPLTWCGRLVVLFRLSFGPRLRVSKIGTLAFILSNSENISCITFLKYKNNRKQELALWYLVNRLVPEMHKNATKCKQNIKQLV
jgi:hypothetical protein